MCSWQFNNWVINKGLKTSIPSIYNNNSNSFEKIMIGGNKLNVIIYLNEEDLDSLGWFFEVVGSLPLSSISSTSCTTLSGTSVNISGGTWDNFSGIWAITPCTEELDFTLSKSKGWKTNDCMILKRFLHPFSKHFSWKTEVTFENFFVNYHYSF